MDDDDKPKLRRNLSTPESRECEWRWRRAGIDYGDVMTDVGHRSVFERLWTRLDARPVRVDRERE